VPSRAFPHVEQGKSIAPAQARIRLGREQTRDADAHLLILPRLAIVLHD